MLRPLPILDSWTGVGHTGTANLTHPISWVKSSSTVGKMKRVPTGAILPRNSWGSSRQDTVPGRLQKAQAGSCRLPRNRRPHAGPPNSLPVPGKRRFLAQIFRSFHTTSCPMLCRVVPLPKGPSTGGLPCRFTHRRAVLKSLQRPLSLNPGLVLRRL